MLVNIILVILGIVLLGAVVSAALCFKEYKHYDCNDSSMQEKGNTSLVVAEIAGGLLIGVVLIQYFIENFNIN